VGQVELSAEQVYITLKKELASESRNDSLSEKEISSATIRVAPREIY
jgi:hypothetical protein